jgi:hypothetical protein
MSAPDTMLPLVSAPWLDADGHPLSVRPLPGLRSEAIQSLECSYPGTLTPAMQALLGTCCGLAGTAIGSIDFTGCWFFEEPYAVFRPALTLAVGDAERRWIAEISDKDLPGPVWCVFPDPEVAVYVSDDVAAFMSTIRAHTCRGEMHAWLRGLTAQARTVWCRRHAWAMRPHEAARSDRGIRGWLLGLPMDAYVYDLRVPGIARGWPYGVAGPSGRLYRCGRLPVFAVAGFPAEGWRAPRPRSRDATTRAPARAEVSFAIETPHSGRKPRPNPENPGPWPSSRRASSRPSGPPIHGAQTDVLELRPCA